MQLKYFFNYFHVVDIASENVIKFNSVIASLLQILLDEKKIFFLN